MLYFSMRYEIAYTLKKQREFEEFKTKRSALAFAKRIIKKGATKVFLDVYDTENDLIQYKHLTKESV